MLALARRWKLRRTTVAEHLKRAGVEVRQRGVPADKLDEAIRLYREGWSCRRLAKHYGCDDETVRQTLKTGWPATASAVVAPLTTIRQQGLRGLHSNNFAPPIAA
jgi:hypothetical protein